MSESFSFDKLIAGEADIATEAGTLLSGQSLARGTLLGKITLGAATKAAKSGGNTGDGTLTLDVTTPILANAVPGVYTVRIVRAHLAAIGTTPAVPLQSAIAELCAPGGAVLAVFDVLTGGGTTVANQVKFVIVDGSTKYALGDGWDITIAAGSGKVKLCNSANTDGSQVPYGVLAETCDATSGDKACSIYLSGGFNSNAMTFGGSDTAATHKTALRAHGIYLRAGTTI